MRVVVCLIALSVAGCGPVPVEQAEQDCLDQARLARQPRVEVEVAAGSGGQVKTSLDLTVSSDYLTGRDPSAVFNFCVQRKSGQFPDRALATMPGWRG